MTSNVGYKPYLVSTAKPAGFPRVPSQSPVKFSVYHGEVLEVQTNQVPTVYGSGRTFLGCGRSSVQTTIVRNTSVWTRDGTGQEKRWDLGGTGFADATRPQCVFSLGQRRAVCVAQPRYRANTIPGTSTVDLSISPLVVPAIPWSFKTGFPGWLARVCIYPASPCLGRVSLARSC